MSEALHPTPTESFSETPTVSTAVDVQPPQSISSDSPLPGEGSLLVEAAPSGESTESAPAKESSESAPESYTDFTLPDGVTVDEPSMTAFQDWAKTNGLSQEAAQAGIDLYGKQLQSQADAIASAYAAQAQQTWSDVNKQWLDELATIPDFQGDRKAESLATIAKALEEYGVGDVRRAFALTGAGNNPAIVQTMLRMAHALSEGTSVPGDKPAPSAPRTTGEALYPQT